MEALDRFTNKVYAKVTGHDTYYQPVSVDPATLLLITKIVFMICEVIVTKYSKDDQEKVIKNPTLFQQILLHLFVMKKVGVPTYYAQGRKLVATILTEAKNLSKDDILELLDR